MEDYIIIAVIGAFAAADITVFGQFMISQPLIATTIAGFLLGDPENALLIGMVMQLMWLKLVPAGGAVYLNGNLGSLTAFCVFHLAQSKIGAPLHSILFISLIYGILASYLIGTATLLQRNINLKIVKLLPEKIQAGNFMQFQFAHIAGSLYTAASGGFIVLAGSVTGSLILRIIPAGAYFSMTEYAEFGIFALLGIGFGTVLSMVWERKAMIYPVFGIITGFILFLFLK
ncbi:PTS sugar transporter subunit IIC [candidate division KSB1 bacterium]